MDLLRAFLILSHSILIFGFPEEEKSCSAFMCAYRLGEKLTLLDVSNSKLKEEITNIKKEIVDLNRKVYNCEEDLSKVKLEMANVSATQDKKMSISLYAMLSSAVPLSNGKRLIFDSVFINKGDAYDVAKGEFKATLAGVYLVNVQVCTKDGGWMNIAVMKNEDMVGKVRSADQVYITCTSSQATVQLNTGDIVWVKKDAGSATLQNTEGWNTFSVNLLGITQ